MTAFTSSSTGFEPRVKILRDLSRLIACLKEGSKLPETRATLLGWANEPDSNMRIFLESGLNYTHVEQTIFICMCVRISRVFTVDQ
jgi:hypothetical protein